jgi:hypothetical protein
VQLAIVLRLLGVKSDEEIISYRNGTWFADEVDLQSLIKSNILIANQKKALENNGQTAILPAVKALMPAGKSASQPKQQGTRGGRGGNGKGRGGARGGRGENNQEGGRGNSQA